MDQPACEIGARGSNYAITIGERSGLILDKTIIA
jgi:hypothetical protein